MGVPTSSEEGASARSASGAKLFLQIGFPVLVTAAFAAYFFRKQDLREYLVYAETLSWPYALAAASTVLPMAWLRAVRLSLFLPKHSLIPEYGIFRIATLHSFLTSVAPSRLGEVALPILLKSSHKAGFAQGAGILILIRMYDALTLFLFCGMAGIAMLASLGSMERYRNFVLLSAPISLAILLLMPRILALCFNVARALFKRTKHRQFIESCYEPAKCLLPAGAQFKLSAICALIWCAIFVFFVLAARALPIDLSLPQLVLGVAGVTFTASAPVNGVASIGPLEAFWGLYLKSQGTGWSQAIWFGILTHFLMLAAHAALALLVWLFPRREK